MAIHLLGKKLSSFQIIILGFLGAILMGAFLLMLPVSSRDGMSASFGTALFTSTSAVCVTGLVVRDTATCWSRFGQAVILALIQTGGLGIVTSAAFIARISGRKISLRERSLLQDSISAHQLGGIVKMTGFIVRVTVIVEVSGALLMLPAFCRQYGTAGIWMAVFHSVSAFCNAGFDIMGDRTGPFSSLTSFAGSPGVVLPVCLLIVIGGIGFLTWEDLYVNRWNVRRYHMQTKVILTTTGILILFPLLFLYLSEYKGYASSERFFLSLFQAVTPRTAGFNTVDLNRLTSASRAMTVVLMLVGGAPGSTAGGVKTTTVAVLLSNAVAVIRRRKDPRLFNRRIDEDTVKSASTLLMLYLLLALLGAFIISAGEGLAFETCLFETASAIGTVGLSLGITPALGLLSRGVLVGLMFFGRAGALTLLFAAVNSIEPQVAQYPLGRINVG